MIKKTNITPGKNVYIDLTILKSSRKLTYYQLIRNTGALSLISKVKLPVYL